MKILNWVVTKYHPSSAPPVGGWRSGLLQHFCEFFKDKNVNNIENFSQQVLEELLKTKQEIKTFNAFLDIRLVTNNFLNQNSNISRQNYNNKF